MEDEAAGGLLPTKRDIRPSQREGGGDENEDENYIV